MSATYLTRSPRSGLRHVNRLRAGACGCTNPHPAHLFPTRRQTVASANARTVNVLRPTRFTSNTASTALLSSAPHLHSSLSQSQTSRISCGLFQHRHASNNMASQLEKVIISGGDGVNKPKKGDTVTMEYTGWLFDPSKEDKIGKKFDSSVGKGHFKTRIGVGQVIAGWDEGVVTMSKGEKARLTIPGHMAYGSRGFPGLIPANATLIFDVQLIAIN